MLTPHAERLRIARAIIDRYEPLAEVFHADPQAAADVLEEMRPWVRAEPDALDVLERAESDPAAATGEAAASDLHGAAFVAVRLCHWAATLLEAVPEAVDDFPRWCRQRIGPTPGGGIRGLGRVRMVRSYHPAAAAHDTLREIVAVAARRGIAPPPIEWPPVKFMRVPLAETAATLCESAERMAEREASPFPVGRPDAGPAAGQLDALIAAWQQFAVTEAHAVCHGSLRPSAESDAASRMLLDRVRGFGRAFGMFPGVYTVAADADVRRQLDRLAGESVRLLYHDEVWPLARRFYEPLSYESGELASWCRFVVAAAVGERIGPPCELRAFGTIAGSWYDTAFARRRSAAAVPGTLAAVDADELAAGHWLACPGGIATPAPLGGLTVSVLRWLRTSVLLPIEPPSTAIDFVASVSPTRVDWTAIDPNERAVLKALADAPVTLAIVEVATNAVDVDGNSRMSERTARKCLSRLEAVGLIDRPLGKRKGYAITEAGRDRLADIRHIPD